MWEINEAFSAVVLANIKVRFTILTMPEVLWIPATLYTLRGKLANSFHFRTCSNVKASRLTRN